MEDEFSLRLKEPGFRVPTGSIHDIMEALLIVAQSRVARLSLP